MSLPEYMEILLLEAAVHVPAHNFVKLTREERSIFLRLSKNFVENTQRQVPAMGKREEGKEEAGRTAPMNHLYFTHLYKRFAVVRDCVKASFSLESLEADVPVLLIHIPVGLLTTYANVSTAPAPTNDKREAKGDRQSNEAKNKIEARERWNDRPICTPGRSNGRTTITMITNDDVCFAVIAVVIVFAG